MNEFDPKNDVIDRYLKGELGEAELKAFEDELQRDAELKKILEERRLVYEVIVRYGQVELKHFLRKQTTQRRLLAISKRNIYYAAAAVALILVTTTVVILTLQKQGGQKPTEVAEKYKATEKLKTTEKPEDANANLAELKDTSSIAIAQSDMVISDSNALLVAANVKVVSIDLGETTDDDAEQETATMSRAPAMAQKFKKEAYKAEPRGDKLANGTDSLTLSESAVNKRLQSSIRMNMNFYNTASGEKTVVYQIGKSGEPELDIFNLPYDNPLLFADGNNTYLKAGDAYYQIELNAGKIQKVKPVSERKLLKRFNR